MCTECFGRLSDSAPELNWRAIFPCPDCANSWHRGSITAPAVFAIVTGPLQTFRRAPLEGWPAGKRTRVKRPQLIKPRGGAGHCFAATVQAASRSAETDALQASVFCNTVVPGETLRWFLSIQRRMEFRSLLASGIEVLIHEPW